jgi:C-terminal processing protease CtpA/Prc
VPVGRTFDPKTGKDWEGSGVLPDLEVPAEDALRRVLVAEGVAAAEAARLSDELKPAIPLTKPQRPVGS